MPQQASILIKTEISPLTTLEYGIDYTQPSVLTGLRIMVVRPGVTSDRIRGHGFLALAYPWRLI